MKRLKEIKEWLHARRIAVRSMDRNKKIKIVCCCLMIAASIGMAIHSLSPKPIDYSQFYNGVCGDNVTYSYDPMTNALTITGDGIMYDYSAAYKTPWVKFRDFINTVVIKEGVKSIGSNNFAGFISITSIIIPHSVKRIGEYAFSSCYQLKSVILPNKSVYIEKDAFSEEVKIVYRDNFECPVHTQNEEYYPSYSDNDDSNEQYAQNESYQASSDGKQKNSETEQEEFVWTPDMSVEQYYQGRPTNLEQTGFYNSQTGQVQQNPVRNQTTNPELDQNGMSVVTGGSRGNSDYLIDQTSIGGKGADLIGTGSSGSSSSRRSSPSRKYSTSEINRQADRTARAYQNYKNNPTIDGANYYHMQEKTLKRMQENK